MKVLVTGASGFLGGYVTEMFLAAGHEVRALVRRTSRTERLRRIGVEIAVGDLTEVESLAQAVEGVEAVVHCAATMTGTPQEFEAATVQGTLDLLTAAEAAGVKRFVHVSSIGVLSMARPADDRPINEDAPYEKDPAFLGIYNSSKIAAERAALRFADRRMMTVVVIRPGILYGPRGKWALPRMGYALGARCFAVIGMGGNRIPVCYAGNCARAIVLAAEKDGVNGEIYNVVDDDPFTQIEYLRRLRREARPGMRILRVPFFLARALGWMSGLAMGLLKRGNPIATAHLVGCVRRLRYSNAHARKHLGWEPVKDTEEALDDTMAWFAESEPISRRAELKVLGKPVRGRPPVSAAIVGCGMIAESHLKILEAMPNATVLAVCDANIETARALAKKYKILHVYDNPEEMLEKEAPRIVHILTPPQSHAEMAKLAIRKGAHVYVEKPMALNLAEARDMVEYAERYGMSLCVGHNHLFDPIMVKARKLIESGALGDPIWVESYYGFDLGNNRAARYMLPGAGRHWTFKIPGGLYQNLAPHPLSVAIDVLGKPDKVVARADPTRVVPHQPTDELRIFMDGPKGSGVAIVSLAASPRFQYLDIHGTRMRLTVDFLNKWIVRESVARGIPKPISRALSNLRHGCTVLWGTAAGMAKVLLKKWTPYDGMALLIREYYASIQEDRDPPVSMDEALATMEIMEETWRQIGPLGDDANVASGS